MTSVDRKNELSPVKETLAIPLCLINLWPTPESPKTTENKLSGQPALVNSSAKRIVVNGVRGDGLKTNALPAAKAGADFQTAICKRKKPFGGSY